MHQLEKQEIVHSCTVVKRSRKHSFDRSWSSSNLAKHIVMRTWWDVPQQSRQDTRRQFRIGSVGKELMMPQAYQTHWYSLSPREREDRRRQVVLRYCSKKHMKADLMTRSINAVQFEGLRNNLGIKLLMAADSSGRVEEKASQPVKK